MIRRFWSRLIAGARRKQHDAGTAVRLAQRGADELWHQPPWDFPNHRPQPDEQPSLAVPDAHDDKRKHLYHADEHVGQPEATDRSHRGLLKGLVVGTLAGIISWACSDISSWMIRQR
jgi:hypothetical protein